MKFTVPLIIGWIFWIPALMHAQEKRVLTVDDFAPWRQIQSVQISHDGAFASWEENPQKYGDGMLQLQTLPDGEIMSFERGGDAVFSSGAAYLGFRISPHFDSLRHAKLTEKDLPGDTLGIWLTRDSRVLLFPGLKSFDLPEHDGSWMAFQQAKEETEETQAAAADTASADSTIDNVPESKELPLTLLNPLTGERIQVPSVRSYSVADSGRLIAMITVSGDSTDSVQVSIFDSQRNMIRTIYEGIGEAESLQFDRSGKRLAFLATQDTGEVQIYDLYGYQMEEASARKLVDRATQAMPEGWAVSQDGGLDFSRSGNRLFFGIAPEPQPEPEDTLLNEEKVSLDVWNWQDKALQPEQLLDVEDELSRTYTCIWFWENATMVQLETETLQNVRLPGDKDGPMAIGYDDDPYLVERSWNYPWRDNVYVVDVTTGTPRLMVEGAWFGATLSQNGNYLVYWNPETLAWHSVNTETGAHTDLTGSIGEHFFDEDEDAPSYPYSYGFAGFMEDEQAGVFYDRYDLWKVRLNGEGKAVNLTKAWGRKQKIRLRNVRLEEESSYLSEDLMLIGFDEVRKNNGFYSASATTRQAPEELLVSDHRYRNPLKAKYADRIVWRRESYQEYPDLYVSDLHFRQIQRISTANPQQEEFLWGDVKKVSWTAYDGTKLEGLLYTPEDFDSSKTYPMLVYFYELVSDRLHNYSMPSPSRSIIYPSYYNSNGYVVFMPDIRYTEGQPGEDAFNCIVSGTDAMIEQFDWIDAERLALQGQSWGGYQTAYLVTRTDLYACAMAGAPVSNMTSAYGGIRWGSGLSRAFQYERTQSRLGVTLWEDRDRYISNSPVFFADEVETPLLMMHNDADGAVPWYQGIEYFVALRRLQKPAWMLVYNDEAHNLTRWPNRIDLTIRMHQFFDHYLMHAPAPLWMTDGIPAVDKGIKTGYELSEE